MFKAFTTSARHLVAIAEDEALALGHDDIGPEHLLLGATRCGGPAETLLLRLGLSDGDVRRCIIERRQGESDDSPAQVTLSPDAVWILAAAVQRADQRDDRRVGSAHVLFALMPSETVQSILRDCEVTPASVTAAVERFAEYAKGDSSHIPPPVDDARALLEIVLRDGEVAAWLSHRGVDKDTVRDAFRGLALDQVAAPTGQLTPVPPSPQ